jgi:OmpA-OmpF porin, OOP family
MKKYLSLMILATLGLGVANAAELATAEKNTATTAIPTAAGYVSVYKNYELTSQTVFYDSKYNLYQKYANKKFMLVYNPNITDMQKTQLTQDIKNGNQIDEERLTRLFQNYIPTNKTYPVYVNFNAGWGYQNALPSGSFAGTLNAGYNFNQYFAVEGGYALLDGNNFNTTETNNIFDVAAKGTLPLSRVFSLYGRLGVGLAYNTWSGTAVGSPDSYCNQGASFVWLAGVGGSFKLSDHFDLHLEDTMYIPQGSSDSPMGVTNLVLFGSQFNF